MRQIKGKAVGLMLVFSVCLGLACQTETTPVNNSNINMNINANANTNAFNTNVSNVNTQGNTGAMIESREPDQYQATVSLRFETTGSQNIAVPPLKAEVAKSGENRRMEFVLTNGERLIYLDRGGRQLVVSPSRKQYAEISREALGFEVRRLLMPDQIVSQVRQVQGVEMVGEEKFGERDVVRYRYGATTNTQTQAGAVQTESFVLVDKETGLPLQSVINSQSQSGNVQGVTGVRVLTEMTDVRQTVDESLFAEPTDYKQVEPEQIRQQVNLLFNAAAAIIGQMMRSAQQPQPTQPQQQPTQPQQQ